MALSRRLSKKSRIRDKKLDGWLDRKISEKRIPGSRKKELTHTYNRARRLLPQMIDFVETIFKKRAGGELHEQIVFLGRGARPFYRIAFRLAEHRGIDRSNIRVIEAGRRFTGKIYGQPDKRREILDYLRSSGVDISKPITFIDTGVIGTVPNDLIQTFKLEGLETQVNGFMFYGRDISHEKVSSYSPSESVKWKLPEFSPRETRSLIEELPKPVTTVKELSQKENRTKAKHVKSSKSEWLGSRLVRKAILDGLTEYIKKHPTKPKPK